MKTWFYLVLIMVLVTLASPPRLRAQSPAEWHDDLVDHMAGTWKLQGQVMGHDAHHEVEAEWVLNHQFLRIHERTDAAAPGSEKRYEAIWFLGYDPVSERYVLHLLDAFGGRFSETLGYGARDGNAIRFVFEYPDGPFHTVFQWSPEKDTWRWLMTQEDGDGKWATFGDFQLTRQPKNLSAIITGAKSREMLQPEAARTPSGATACTRPAFGDIKITVWSWTSIPG
jgi:hypothetical protein